jgi:chromosome segregation ATPase
MSSDTSLRLGELNAHYETLLAQLTDLEAESAKLTDSLTQDAQRLHEDQTRLERAMQVLLTKRKQLREATMLEQEEKMNKQQQDATKTTEGESETSPTSTVEELKNGLVGVQDLLQQLEVQLAECEREYAQKRQTQMKLMAEIANKRRMIAEIEAEMKALANA